MINYDQGDGVQVEVSGVSNKSMKSVLTMTNIAMTQVRVSPGVSLTLFRPSLPFPALIGLTINHRLKSQTLSTCMFWLE